MSGAGSGFYQRSLPATLRRHLRLIFVDLRGSGRSAPFPVASLTLEGLVDDLEQLRQALGLEQVAVFGHSMHAVLPVLYACTHPTHASHAILVGALPRAMQGVAEARRAYWAAHASAERQAVAQERAPQLQALQSEGTTEAQIRRYVLASHLYWFDPRFDCAFLWEGTTFPPQWPARFMALWDGYDLPGRFPEVPCPVFLGQGRYDFACPPTLWDGERERFPDGTYRLFERSGHAPQLDEPGAFTAAVSAWLTPAAARRRPSSAARRTSQR